MFKQHKSNKGVSQNWALLGAPRFSWELLGSTGSSWALVGAPRLSWKLLGSSGSSQALLGAPGLSWDLLGSPGISWALLGAPRFCWKLLGSPGGSWALLGAPGLSRSHSLGRCVLLAAHARLPLVHSVKPNQYTASVPKEDVKNNQGSR